MAQNNPSSSASSPPSPSQPQASIQEMLMWPFVAGRVAMDVAMSASVMAARMAQIAAQSADSALAKYIDLAEQEISRRGRGGYHPGAAGRESVKVE